MISRFSQETLWSTVFVLGWLLTITAAWGQANPAKEISVELEVARTVADKDIVLLGELPSHGEARGFQAKAEIVKHLVNDFGFNAVIFEAPIYNFLGFQDDVAKKQANAADLDKAIGGFWLNLELKEWRAWLFSQTVEGKVQVAGLDDQVSASSDYARSVLPGLVAANVAESKAEACRTAVERNLFWQYNDEHPFNEKELKLLKECSDTAADALQDEANSADQVMATSLANLYSRQGKAPDALHRDERMYRNLQWHLERLPAESQVVVWTATVHAARQQGELPFKPMGTWLSESSGERMAAIGLTAFAGESSMAGMPKKPLPELPVGALEDLTTTSTASWVFLNADQLREMGDVPSRLLGKIKTADWSTFFDGVLVIREEVAPVFEPRR